MKNLTAIKVYSVVFFLLLSFLFTSCQEKKGNGTAPDGGQDGRTVGKAEDSNAGESINDYFPHQAGDEFSYWLILKNKEGTTGGEVDMKFTGKEKIGETECFVSEIVAEGQTVGKNYYEITPDKILLHRQSRPEGVVVDYDPPLIVVKYPFKSGDSWVNANKGDDTETKCSVEAEEEIELPMGKVKAWKVKSEIVISEKEKVESDSWFAKGIGKVQERNYSQSDMDSMESLITLKYYTVAGVNSRKEALNKAQSLKNAHRDVHDYFPLKPGSRWIYRDTTTGQEGKEAVQENLYEIMGVEEYQGKECIILNRLMHRMPMFASKDLYVVEGDKVYTFGSKDIKEGKKEPSLMLKFPFKAGEKWESDSDSIKRTHTVIGEEDVEVPAGKFKAWKIVNEYIISKGVPQTSNVTVWYAKDVGVVKVDSLAKSKDKTVKNRMELLEYNMINQR